MKKLQFMLACAVCVGTLAIAGAAQQQAANPAANAATSAASPGQVPPSENAATAEEALRQRTAAYYAAVIKGDRAGARKYVNPESSNNFENMDMRSLTR